MPIRKNWKTITAHAGGVVVIVGAVLVLNTASSTTSYQAAEGDPHTASYYVSPAGDDAAPGTNPQRPLASIQKALELADAGDVIELADGEYAQSIRSVRSGTKDAPITIKGSRSAVVRGGSDSRIIEIHHDYITLEGFSVNGQNGGGLAKSDFKDKLIYVIGTKPRDGVEGLKIKNMLVENAGGECIRLRYFARNNEINDTTIRHCGVYDFRFNDGGKNGEAIYIGTAPEQRKDGKNPTADPDESRDNWVHHNTIESYGNECVDVKEAATKNIIEYNHCSQQLDPKSGGMDARGSYNTFRYNLIENNRGAGVRLGGDGEGDGLHNDVYGNTLKDNAAGPVRVLRHPQGKLCGNVISGTSSVQDEESRNLDVAEACI